MISQTRHSSADFDGGDGEGGQENRWNTGIRGLLSFFVTGRVRGVAFLESRKSRSL